MSEKKFKANGRTYYEHESLSLARFEKLEELLIRLQHGSEYLAVVSICKQAFEDLNNHRFGSAAVKLDNVITSSESKLSGAKHPLLLIGTLFFCYEREDRSKWDEAHAESKISDWEKEGLDTALFFSKIQSYYTGFMIRLQSGSQTIS